MSESIGVQLPDIEHPPLDEEAGLILVSGPMRSGKTTAGINYANALATKGNLESFRPIQDKRSRNNKAESQDPRIDPIHAHRVADLGPLAVRLAYTKFVALDAVYLDEPFFWANKDFTPDMDSFRVVQNALKAGSIVVVSTLDKSYMEQEFEWYRMLVDEGTNLEDRGLAHFQHVQMQGFCDLCDTPNPLDANRSVSTNLYVDGIKITSGDQNIPDDGSAELTYVPCCEECRDANLSLPHKFEHKFAIDKAI